MGTGHDGGESPHARLVELRTRLEKADSTQEIAQDEFPKETRAFYLAKGRLLTLIEKLHRIAFDGDALTAADFNKEMLLRARRAARGKRGEKPAEPVESQTGEGEAAKSETAAG
ncbi:MAG TPA: hypothetical protein DFS52_10545 [Myxococcales bacterium]|jgi:hypothetical protein|nr:hypothetical protein [Myxococcales bacterium]